MDVTMQTTQSNDPSGYLAPGRYVDSDHPAVIAFAHRVAEMRDRIFLLSRVEQVATDHQANHILVRNLGFREFTRVLAIAKHGHAIRDAFHFREPV